MTQCFKWQHSTATDHNSITARWQVCLTFYLTFFKYKTHSHIKHSLASVQQADRFTLSKWQLQINVIDEFSHWPFTRILYIPRCVLSLRWCDLWQIWQIRNIYVLYQNEYSYRKCSNKLNHTILLHTFYKWTHIRKFFCGQNLFPTTALISRYNAFKWVII